MLWEYRVRRERERRDGGRGEREDRKEEDGGLEGEWFGKNEVQNWDE